MDGDGDSDGWIVSSVSSRKSEEGDGNSTGAKPGEAGSTVRS